MGRPLLGVALLAAAMINRIVESWVVGWGTVRDPVAMTQFWLYPIRDLLGFIVWVASYTSPTVVWRDTKYELKGEKIVMRKIAETHTRGMK